MLANTIAILASAAAVSAVAIPGAEHIETRATSVSVTPHDRYSSSVGVLGCKINVNRVAYWPQSVGCDNLCVRVRHKSSGRSVTLLRIDQSGGAYDISYDAWNYLVTGQSATVKPVYGGGEAAEYETVAMSECASILSEAGGKLPLTAANSMNFVANCLNQPNSWVAKNYKLWNIFTPVCTYGIDEVCTLNMAVSNQPSCPHQLGLTNPYTADPVWNIDYGTGKLSKAL